MNDRGSGTEPPVSLARASHRLSKGLARLAASGAPARLSGLLAARPNALARGLADVPPHRSSRRRTLILALAAILALGILALISLLGCSDDNGTEPTPENIWSALGAGFSHPVRALTVFNGDLVAGGSFVKSGDSTMNGIARWNGSAWHSVDGGVGPAGSAELVRALAVYDGELIAGGGFSLAGQSSALHIARLDGNEWRPLGSGIDSTVVALVVWNDRLIAGGGFADAGGHRVGGIAQWDGEGWLPIESDIPESIHPVRVNALTVYHGDLVAAGTFDLSGNFSYGVVARWSGAGWTPLGPGMNGEVNALAVWNDRLIAGGVFTAAGSTPLARIAQWDGQVWQPVGTGLSDNLEGFPYPGVSCLGAFGSDLFAGGFFRKAGGNWANCIARWDGAAWSAIGGTDLPVSALAVHEDGLILGGGFQQADGITALRVARWGP